jgi:hypothetical protein
MSQTRPNVMDTVERQADLPEDEPHTGSVSREKAPGGMVVAKRPQLAPLRLCTPLWADCPIWTLTPGQAISFSTEPWSTPTGPGSNNCLDRDPQVVLTVDPQVPPRGTGQCGR